jgi:hypothetical protein
MVNKELCSIADTVEVVMVQCHPKQYCAVLLSTAVCCSQLLCAALHCIKFHCTILLLVTHLVVRAGVPILMPPGVIADTSPGMVFCK